MPSEPQREFAVDDKVRQRARAAATREFRALYDPIFTTASTGDRNHPVRGQIDYDAKAAFDSALEAAANSVQKDSEPGGEK